MTPNICLERLICMKNIFLSFRYNHLTLPVLALAEVVARDILKNKPYTELVHLRATEVCIELNMMNGVNFHKELAQVSGLILCLDMRMLALCSACSHPDMWLWSTELGLHTLTVVLL